MLPYLIILGFVCIWIALEKKAVNRKSFWIPLLTLSLFASIRNYTVGTDTKVYVGKFLYQLNPDYISFNENLEYGYQFLELILLRLTYNYFWLLLTTSLFITSCYLFIFRKYSVNYLFSVFIYITLGTYLFPFNGLRQGIAMAIIAIGIPYLLEKKTIKFLLIVGLASLFHTSALFIAPFYFLINLNIKNYYKPIIALLASTFVSQLVINYIASTNQRYEGYTKTSENAGGFIILAFHIAVILMLYFVTYLYRIKNSDFNKLLTYQASGVLFIIPVALIGTNPSGPQRLLSYFTWTAVLLIPYALKKVNNIVIYILAVSLSIIYFILTTSRFSGLVPYVLNPIFKVF